MRPIDKNNLRASDESKKPGSKTMPILWGFAFVSLTVAVTAFFLIQSFFPEPVRPPDPANLQDSRQTYALFSSFNRLVTEEKWDEATKMLSSAGLQRLQEQNKSLRESILGEKKDMRVAEASVTDSVDRGLDRVRQDCIYKFDDGQYIIVPLFTVIENEKLVIDAWAEL